MDTNPTVDLVARFTNLGISAGIAKYFSKEQVAKRKEEVEK